MRKEWHMLAYVNFFLYLRTPPWLARHYLPRSPIPPKIRSRPAGYMQGMHFFAVRFVSLSCLIIKEPKFYLREYEPRKNSGIKYST